MVCDLWLVDLNPFCVSRFVAFDSNYDWRHWKTQLAAFELWSSHVCEKRSKPLCYLLPCQMCWQIPRKIFLRLGGLAIKSLINDVPQRFLACCSTVNTTFILFYTNSTLPFYCVVSTWYVVTYKSKSYLLVADRYFFSVDFCLFRRLAQFCPRCCRFWACLRTGYELAKFAF